MVTESVVVTVQPPPCPEAGAWLGKTANGKVIKFTVKDDPECVVQPIELYDCPCFGCVKTVFYLATPIINYRFDTGHPDSYVKGTFTSRTEANGSYRNQVPCGIPPYPAVTEGTWTASYAP